MINSPYSNWWEKSAMALLRTMVLLLAVIAAGLLAGSAAQAQQTSCGAMIHVQSQTYTIVSSSGGCAAGKTQIHHTQEGACCQGNNCGHAGVMLLVPPQRAILLLDVVTLRDFNAHNLSGRTITPETGPPRSFV